MVFRNIFRGAPWERGQDAMIPGYICDVALTRSIFSIQKDITNQPFFSGLRALTLTGLARGGYRDRGPPDCLTPPNVALGSLFGIE